jgi:hypothetical protein
MMIDSSPYEDGPCQRCGKPSEVVLKIGQQVVKGEDKYLPDRGLCLACCEIEKKGTLGGGSRNMTAEIVPPASIGKPHGRAIG